MDKRRVRISFVSGEQLYLETTEETLRLLDEFDGFNKFIKELVITSPTLLAIDRIHIEAVVLLEEE